MKSYQHQIDKANECFNIIKATGYVYLAGKPRSGKTLTSLLIAEKSTVVKSVLILTKKSAIPGWQVFLNDQELNLQHRYTVTNYEQVGSIGAGAKYKLKLNSDDYQLVIIDESHNLGTLGKPSNRIKLIRRLCYNMPHIHLSGTAIVESPNSIFHQMYISKYTPFKYMNFYKYFKDFGIPSYIVVAGRDIQQYHKYKLELLKVIDSFTVYMTQEDAGINKELQAVDKLHYITLSKGTKALYNKILQDKFSIVHTNCIRKLDLFSEPELAFNETSVAYDLVCDSTMKERTSLHMIESGIAKIDNNYIFLGNLEKINYIKDTFGDVTGVGVMCHFIGERMLLEKHFNNIEIYSSTSHAEGVDLSHLKHFVIMSSGYSGAKFIQRRDRIVNITGSNTTTVNHLLVKGAISDQVYKKTSKKEDFNNSTYKRDAI